MPLAPTLTTRPSEDGLPTGLVTFLFTDIEGSTIRWERNPEQMRLALLRHNTILNTAIENHGGMVFETAGDSFVIVFADAMPALEAAVAAQHALLNEDWPSGIRSLRVRMSLHTGKAENGPNGYEANHALSRQSRMLAIAHGGQVLLSKATRDLVLRDLTPTIRLRYLGEVRLKDLVEPEHVYQALAPAPPWSLPSEFPPLRLQHKAIGNLPSTTIPFFGRDATVDDTVQHLTESPRHLVTFIGPGGIGKTRLALRTAERLLHRFADGVFFVDLSPIHDHRLVIPTIAAALGPSESGGWSVSDTLAEHVADRAMLLVLDNFEQVVDAARDIADLLAVAPQLRVLATSRTALRIQHEIETPISPLDEDDAVSLFADRAGAATPSFVLDEATVPVVTEICRRLEGIPLALVLAAARTSQLSPNSLLDRLGSHLATPTTPAAQGDEARGRSRLELLTDGARDLPLRHQRLRDTIEWSHDLLNGRQQTQYALLSSFTGGFRLDSAQALLANWGFSGVDVAIGVADLVSASLVEAHDAFDGATRYRMLETIGEHARTKLVRDQDTELTSDRHAQHFLALAQEGAPHMRGEDQQWWLPRLEEEQDNFRVALAWATAQPLGSAGSEPNVPDHDRARSAIRLTATLSRFWFERANLSEAIEHLSRALALLPVWTAGTTSDTERTEAKAAGARITSVLGWIHRRRGDLDQARTLATQALDAHRELGDDKAESKALSQLGLVSFVRGDLANAREWYSQALEAARASGDKVEIGGCLLDLGNIARDTGDRETARSLYEQCRDVSAEHDEIGELSIALNNLANLALDDGAWDQARDLHRRSLSIRNSVGNTMLVAESLVGMASVELAKGGLPRAAQLIGAAEAIAKSVGGHFDPMERRLYDHVIATITGAPEAASLAEEQRLGQDLTVENAVAYALS